jgi:hypothetical protein
MVNGDVAAPVRWEWLVEGYRGALDRFMASADARDKPEQRFIPLFEALNWVAPMMKYPGRDYLFRDEIVLALRHVRNRVHHDFADALEARDVPYPPGLVTRGGEGAKVVGPATVLEWFWKWPDQLPPPEREDKEGEKAYEQRLAGEPVENALAHLNSLL